MFVIRSSDVAGTARDVDWGSGTSVRLTVEDDALGCTVAETWVRPGTRARLRYDNHLESCYCVEGSGYVEVDGVRHPVQPGTLYAPGKGEGHILASDEGMRLISVFTPPLQGTESHSLDATLFSTY